MMESARARCLSHHSNRGKVQFAYLSLKGKLYALTCVRVMERVLMMPTSDEDDSLGSRKIPFN